MSENKFGEPWSPDGPEDMRDRNLVILSSTEWNRAVACVNACRDIDSPTDMRRQMDGLVKVLKAYEAWEADILVNGDWRNSLPIWQQHEWIRLREIQTMRNTALAAAGRGGKEGT